MVDPARSVACSVLRPARPGSPQGVAVAAMANNAAVGVTGAPFDHYPPAMLPHVPRFLPFPGEYGLGPWCSWNACGPSCSDIAGPFALATESGDGIVHPAEAGARPPSIFSAPALWSWDGARLATFDMNGGIAAEPDMRIQVPWRGCDGVWTER